MPAWQQPSSGLGSGLLLLHSVAAAAADTVDDHHPVGRAPPPHALRELRYAQVEEFVRGRRAAAAGSSAGAAGGGTEGRPRCSAVPMLGPIRAQPRSHPPSRARICLSSFFARRARNALCRSSASILNLNLNLIATRFAGPSAVGAQFERPVPPALDWS
eukprot:SAG31_NODE_7029_length_1812_cov_2.639813_2_plen_159_part_00